MPRSIVLLVALAVAGATTPPWWDRDPARVALSIPTAWDVVEGVAGQPPPSSHEASVRRIIAVFDDLRLPLPRRIRVYLYDSPALFERGLIVTGGLSATTARKVRRFAVGATIDDMLLVLASESRQGRLPWLRLLAHEMTHLAQIELAGGEDPGPRWLTEGMAEWVAFTVLERLGVAGTGVARAVIMQRGRGFLDVRAPPLARLADAKGFLRLIQDAGAAPVYHLAFFLVDRLVERHGFQTLVDYFRATGKDRRASFEQAFGQRLGEFERTVRSTCPPATAVAAPGTGAA